MLEQNLDDIFFLLLSTQAYDELLHLQNHLDEFDYDDNSIESWSPIWGAKYTSLRVGKIRDTQFPNPNYPNPEPKYPNPKYPITISDSDCKNPKLVSVIRVMFPGTRTTQIT
jgi:hypothetical protein